MDTKTIAYLPRVPETRRKVFYYICTNSNIFELGNGWKDLIYILDNVYPFIFPFLEQKERKKLDGDFENLTYLQCTTKSDVLTDTKMSPEAVFLVICNPPINELCVT